MKKYIFLMAVMAILTSCSGSKFKVSGVIDGANDSTKIYLEFATNGTYVPFDSTSADNSGAYSFSEDPAEYPNIYRLRCNDKSIFFTIDSIDNLTINSKLKTFDTDFSIDGTEHAKQVEAISKQVVKYNNGKATAAQLEAWKHELASKYILKDPAGIVAYYIINLYVNGQQLFNPLNDFDMKIIGAVANGYNSFAENDPRTQYLVNMTMDAQRRRRAANGQGGTVQAQEVNIIDIKLQNVAGQTQSLAQLAGKGKVVLLNFASYDNQMSPAFNKMLNDLYTKYNGQLIIYQVGLDESIGEWNTAAKNLPWVCVYDPSGINSTNVANYNVVSYFTSFIIDKSGQIVKRIDDPFTNTNTLSDELAKYI